MRPGRHAERSGFVLLPVVLTLALLGATTYLMARESALGSSLVSAKQRQQRARYLAEAALRHAEWQVQDANCSGFSDVATTSFAGGSYDATVAPSGGSPVSVAATGTLADGTTYHLTRSGEPAYQTPTSVVLQPDAAEGKDAYIWAAYPSTNYGTDNETWVSRGGSNTSLSLLQFDLGAIPAGVRIVSATLTLYHKSGNDSDVPVTAHRITNPWNQDFVTWNDRDDGTPWDAAGGDVDATVFATTLVGPTSHIRYEWNLTGLVQGWTDGSYANHGFALATALDGAFGERFGPSDDAHPHHRPELTITYACECGQVCGATGSGDELLLVVGNAATPSGKDSDRKALIQSWGYAVTLIDDGDSQADFDAATAAADVVYVTASIGGGTLADKLTGSNTAIVNEFSGKLDNFGFSSATTYTFTADTFTASDAAHYISSPFAGGAIDALTTFLTMPIPGGTLAPGLEFPASFTGFERAVVTLDVGATRWDAAPAPARRVHLPFGPAETTQLTTDGQTIMRRSIEWAGGAGCGTSTPLLLVVSDAGNPSPQEAARQTLMESWCYAVTRIDDDATLFDLAAGMTSNDVIYISQEITSLTNVSKLRDATIGVVNEEYLISSDLGFGSGTGTGFYDDINLVDDTHYITSESGLGALALFTPSYDIYTGTGFTLAPDLQVLGEAGSITGLAALDTGGDLWDSGTAAGRRVLVPWGDDFSALNSDGQTLMRRALEWAAGAGCGSLQPVLLVVGDPTLPLASRDAGRKELIESGCFTVSVIDDGDSQTNFDTAVDAADAVFVSGTSSGPALLDKLTGITKGVVNEINGKLDNFGFSSSTSSTVDLDTFSQTNAAHYITEPFSGNPVTIFTASMTNPVPGGTLAPDLSNVGEVTGTVALATLDAGATRWDGNPAPARRVHLPFGSAEISQLTPDGETAMRRAIEWAAGSGAGGGGGGEPGSGPVFESFEEYIDADNNSAAISVARPAGTVAGDLLVAVVVTNRNNESTLVADDAGWTLLTRDAQANAMTVGVWWKLAGSSEPSSYGFSWDAAAPARSYSWIMRFSGNDPTDPIDVWDKLGEGGTTSPLSPAVTTSVGDTLILRIGGFDDDDITIGDPGMAGHTPITMQKSNTGTGTVSGGAAYVSQAASGNSGTANFTLTASEQSRTITIGIAPAP